MDVPAPAIVTVHAEGRLPGGGNAQVRGGLRVVRRRCRADCSAIRPPPTRACRACGCGPSTVAARFLQGRISLRFKLESPLLPPGCTLGASGPPDFRLKRPGPSQWLSRDPPLVPLQACADGFAAPAVESCGLLTGLPDQRLGLPAATGNLMSYDAPCTFRTYDHLAAR